MRDDYKDIIIDSLAHLSKKGKVDVFAFVIMPNHLHLIWRVNENNGKETSSGSFLKHTAHAFKNKLKIEQPDQLANYSVNAVNKQFEFWQRDSLAIRLFSEDIAFQKLDYIHANPVSGRWQLVNDYCDYKYSTAKYYELGVKEFDFIKDLREEY
ncbi:MAG: transposase [Cyclobacteriaceae bacterium]|nr:transposase [Cyclobacteriaceae bacterium]